MSRVERLVARLHCMPPGRLPDSVTDEILDFVQKCWEEFSGAFETKMEGWKVQRDKGAQDITWNPPTLSFITERHGGMGVGSTRAEKQKWTLHLGNKTAHYKIVGYRQVYPSAPKLDVKSIADGVCDAVREGPTLDSELAAQGVLIWTAKDEITIKHGKLVPNDGPMQTISGRRKRFRTYLESKMKEMGWELIRVRQAIIFKKRPD